MRASSVVNGHLILSCPLLRWPSQARAYLLSIFLPGEILAELRAPHEQENALLELYQNADLKKFCGVA